MRSRHIKAGPILDKRAGLIFNRDMKYTVETWTRGTCTNVRSIARPATVVRHANCEIADGAERVWVRRDGQAVYTFDGFWMKHAGDLGIEIEIGETE